MATRAKRKSENDVRTLFVSAPFKTPNRPPIGIATLKSVLQKAGYYADCLHLSVYLADYLGSEVYSFYEKNYWFGEALFAQCLFSDETMRKRLAGRYGNFIKSAPDRSIPAQYHNYSYALKKLKHENKDKS